MIQPNVELHPRTTRDLLSMGPKASGHAGNPDVGILSLETKGLAVAYLNDVETDRAQEGYIRYILNDS